jgi:hypothetical protein
LAEAFGWKKFWSIEDGNLQIFGETVVPKVIPNIRTFQVDDSESSEGADTPQTDAVADRIYGVRYPEPLAWGLCPWILIQLEGIQIRALVDSGAECNCMSKGLVELLGYEVETPEGRIRSAIGFDGKKIPNQFVGQISDAEVVVTDGNGASATIYTTFQVSRHMDPKFKILLGSPFRVKACLGMSTDAEGDCKITVVCQRTKQRVAVIAGIGEFKDEKKTKAMISAAKAHPKEPAGRKK